MVRYRRAKVAGGCYFLTLALQDRRSDLLFKSAALLRRCLQSTQVRLHFRVPALVVLPDHLHMLMVLPPDDADFSARIRMLKASFVGALRQQVGSEVRTNAKGEANIWQRRFWEHLIRDEQDYCHHVDYIHINPLKHGLVTRVRDWPFSSFHHYVRQGLLPIDWAGGADVEIEDAGE
ncbi:REP-associated tyrosine transposase [Ectopseudomonas mendocina]|uniref:REP-associated tyrosine transposase n=1 Tax=Ectopseudomonas mendocina TaxID=300 RepID=UPI0005A63DDE|nr:transposase [Pseudomonas mendocina]VEE14260.1 transposase [Pseudomonas mendocina]